MPIAPDDATPPYGTEIPEERDTSPDLSAGLRCPTCKGERMVLTVAERNAEGNVIKAVANPCETCRGAGIVDRKTFTRIRAISQGRPPR